MLDLDVACRPSPVQQADKIKHFVGSPLGSNDELSWISIAFLHKKTIEITTSQLFALTYQIGADHSISGQRDTVYILPTSHMHQKEH